MTAKRYRPIPVVHLLKEMQNLTSLILDLAYSAVMFHMEGPTLQKEVYRLENKLDELVYHLEIQTMLATRDLDDAEANISFMRIGQALNRVSDAAADIATLSGAGLPDIVTHIVEKGDERIRRLEIEQNPWEGLLKAEISDIEEFFGIDVMAINRGHDWIFAPYRKTKHLRREDLIFVRGPQLALDVLKRTVTGEIRENDVLKEELQKLTTEVPKISYDSMLERRVVQTLAKLKNKSELSISLAFSALLMNDQRLSREVERLETDLDHLDRTLGLLALKLESETLDQQVKIWNLIRLSKALEEIADASQWLIDPFRLNIERHPLLREFVQETEEKTTVHEIEEDSEAIDTTIAEFEARVHGMWVVAVYKPDVGYYFDPPANYRISKGETLIIKAYGRQKHRIRLFEDSGEHSEEK